MEPYSVYIPMDRRHALAQERDIPDRVEGAALFADISGFTPLTESLVRELGPQRGAEELTRQLNEVYDALIKELHRYGGSVISFAGDAITCWFDEDGGLRAATCGLAMQEVMDHFSTITIPSEKPGMTGMTVSLAMKVGIAVGQARRFVVGDPKYQLIDVLAGATLDQMAAAEHHAEKGEVILASLAAKSLEGQVSIAEWRVNPDTGERFGLLGGMFVLSTGSPIPKISPEQLLEEKVVPWLLPPVYRRLHRGQGEFLAELRPAVSLFLGFGGIDYDGDEGAGEKLDSYIRWVQGTLARYEGFLLQLTVGDKGSSFNATFGAPIAHEDDPVRAVSAALELCKVPDQWKDTVKDVRIGVSLGRMRTGAYGGKARRTYGVMGDDVNLSARLMQAAGSGQIFVSERVRLNAGNDFNWEDLPALRVKGKADLVAAYRAVDVRQRRTFHLKVPEYALPMVGRESELLSCEDKMKKAISGQGQVVGVRGQAGLGKTRLVAEVIRLASEFEMVRFGGDCESYGTDTSYLVWQSVWRGFFDLDPTWSISEQVVALEKELHEIDPDLVLRLPLLGAVLNLSIPDNELTASFDAKLRKTSLETLLIDCLRARALQEPILIVLEDCQWLDPLSHDLIEVVGRAVADRRVLIVMTYRPPELSRLQEPRVSELPNFSEIHLEEFTPEESEQLIRLKLAQLLDFRGDLPIELVRGVTSRAAGNPFYIEELLNYLHDHGIDPHDPGAMFQIELPTSLHSLILSRLDRLSEDQKTTIKVASVIGRLFKAALLWGMYPELGESDRVTENLQALVQMQLTQHDPVEPELTYFFRQIITQEVAYESLPYAMRTILHDQLARYIEENFQETIDQYIDLLAYHFLRAQDWDKALVYNLLTAQSAQREFANEVAIISAQRVLDAAARVDGGVEVDEDRLTAHELLGEVLTLVGRYDEALDHYNAAMTLVKVDPESTGQIAHLAELSRKTAEVYERRSEYDEAFGWLERGLNLLEKDMATIEAARIYLLGAGVYQRQGNNEKALEWCQRSLDTALEIKTREGQQVMAQTYYLIGLIYYRLGELRKAVDYCQESVKLFQEIEDVVGEARAFNNLGMAYSDQGDWGQASDVLHKGLKIQQKIGNIFSQGAIANNLADIHRDRGEWDEAVELYQQSNSIWKRLGAPLYDAVTLSNLAQVQIYRENYLQAKDLLSLSVSMFNKIESEDYLPELERRWGEYHLKTGDLEQALAHTQQSLEMAITQKTRLEEGLTTRVLGEIYLARKEYFASETTLRKSLKILREVGSEFEANRAVISLARLALASGEVKISREELEQAINIFEKLGAKVDLEVSKGLAKVLGDGEH